jgi:hypothetical protein
MEIEVPFQRLGHRNCTNDFNANVANLENWGNRSPCGEGSYRHEPGRTFSLEQTLGTFHLRHERLLQTIKKNLAEPTIALGHTNLDPLDSRQFV